MSIEALGGIDSGKLDMMEKNAPTTSSPEGL